MIILAGAVISGGVMIVGLSSPSSSDAQLSLSPRHTGSTTVSISPQARSNGDSPLLSNLSSRSSS